jgi:hypothetical protein
VGVLVPGDFEAVEVGEDDFEAVELGEDVPVGGSVADAAGVVVGVPVGVVVGVAVGVGVRVGVGVLVGVGLGVGVGSLSCSHAWPVPLAAAAVIACVVAALARLPWATDAATENPVAVAASTPPVTRLTVTGRTCVKRMRAPARPARFCGNDYSVWCGYIRRTTARLVPYHPYWISAVAPGATGTTTQSAPD